MKNSSSGFTLIEIMVAVIIIAALAGMVLPHLMNKPDEAKARIAQGEIQGIYTGLKLYKLDTGKYPTADKGLTALMSNPGSLKSWQGPYMEKTPNDPWKNPFNYKNPGSRHILKIDVYSSGPDGQPDNEDDVWLDE